MNTGTHILWGSMTALAGLLLGIGGTKKSEVILYRLVAARSRLPWGDHVYLFHLISGVMVILFGLLIPLGKV